MKIGANGTDINSTFLGASSLIAFKCNGTERMRIDSSGKVGIGTTSPSETLHMFKATYPIFKIESTSYNGTLGIDTGNGNLVLNNVSNAGLLFNTNNTERMRIDSSGNLLVGTTLLAPTTGGIVLYKDSTRGIVRSGTNTTAADAVSAWYNPNGKVGQIVTSGSLTSYNTNSDQRLKENIADADDAGSKIDAIQVRKYDWKADGSHQDYGMIAQELVEVAPEAVTVPADSEEMMGVDYSKLVPMMLKEIQSLRNRVAQLEE
jgi:hypothetical protein